MEKEIWKPIKGYEGLYDVSNFGRVKMLKRVTAFGCSTKNLSRSDKEAV
jgi:hypothetical protein